MNKIKEKFLQDVEQFNVDVSGYSSDVYNSRSAEVISNIIASAPVLSRIIPQTGIKANTTAELTILETDVTWSTADCVASETGDNTVLFPREISVVRLTDREEICLDKLDKFLPMLNTPGAQNEDMTFADKFIEMKIKKNALEIQKLAFQGDTTITAGNLRLTDGWLKIASNELSSLNYHRSVTNITGAKITSGALALAAVQDLVANRSDAMYEMGADELVIFLDNHVFDLLAAKYLDDYGVNATGIFENTGYERQAGIRAMRDPQSGVLILATNGMKEGEAFMTDWGNLVYGTDLESDKEQVKLFYSDYHEKVVSVIKFAIGFQYKYPERVSYIYAK